MLEYVLDWWQRLWLSINRWWYLLHELVYSCRLWWLIEVYMLRRELLTAHNKLWNQLLWRWNWHVRQRLVCNVLLNSGSCFGGIAYICTYFRPWWIINFLVIVYWMHWQRLFHLDNLLSCWLLLHGHLLLSLTMIIIISLSIQIVSGDRLISEKTICLPSWRERLHQHWCSLWLYKLLLLMLLWVIWNNLVIIVSIDNHLIDGRVFLNGWNLLLLVLCIRVLRLHSYLIVYLRRHVWIVLWRHYLIIRLRSGVRNRRLLLICWYFDEVWLFLSGLYFSQLHHLFTFGG